jgi:hypothetical protein
MTTIRLCALLTFAVAACACGNSSYVDGNFHGEPIAAPTATFISGSSPRSDGSLVYYLVLQLGPDGCGPQTRGSRVFGLGMYAPADFEPGTYPVRQVLGTSADPEGWAWAGEVTDACETDRVSALGGSITLASLSHDHASGSFDVQLVTGEHLIGAFEAEPCPGLAVAPTCK